MTITTSLFSFLSICATITLLSIQCAYSPPSQPMLTIRDISTPDGSSVDSSTVINATISYRIPRFEAHSRTYTLALMFQNTRGRPFSIPPNDFIRLGSSDSVVRFSYRLYNVWNNKNVARPFILTFFLMESASTQERTRINDRIELGPLQSVIATSAPIRLMLRK